MTIDIPTVSWFKHSTLLLRASKSPEENTVFCTLWSNSWPFDMWKFSCDIASSFVFGIDEISQIRGELEVTFSYLSGGGN